LRFFSPQSFGEQKKWPPSVALARQEETSKKREDRILKDKLRHSAAFVTACLPALIYIIWLNAYYWLLKGGRYQAFIQPKLWPLLILSLILLLAFSAAVISQFSLPSNGAHRLETWIKAAILILPVLFLWTIYGQSLGTDAFAKRALSPDQNFSLNRSYLKTLPARSASNHTTTLLDLMLDAEKFNRRQVAVEGMVYRGQKMKPNRFKLFRFAIICCAADALPFSVDVQTATESDLANDSWVRVEGRFNTDTINGKQVADITADRVLSLPTPPPERRYLFF
jgi:uncharacterized repeat protein (TIGR03943 family)